MNVIVEREKGLLELEKRIAELRAANASQPVDMMPEIAALEQKYQEILHDVFGSLTPWEKVNMARHPARPTSLDYLGRLDRFDGRTATATSATIPPSSADSRCSTVGRSWRSDSSAAATPRKICDETSAW